MHLEIFAHGHSWLHHMDPRAKLLAALGLSLVVSLAPWPMAWLGGLAVAMVLAASARLCPGAVLKRLAVINIFVLMIWLVVPWQLGWDGGPTLAWSPAGAGTALAVTIKTNAIVLTLMALLATSPVAALVHALAHLHVPPKLVHLFLLFYRYLHVMHQEYHRLTLAMRARGFIPRNNMHTYRSYAHLAGMVLVRSYDRAERVYQAMLCRGFSGTLWLLDHFTWGRRESLFLAGTSMVCLGLIALGWVWGGVGSAQAGGWPWP